MREKNTICSLQTEKSSNLMRDIDRLRNEVSLQIVPQDAVSNNYCCGITNFRE